MNLTPEEMEMWQSLLGQFPAGRGQLKAAFKAAIKAALSNNAARLTREELIAEIKKRLT